MFKRPRHQAIAKLLACFDARALAAADCYFGGGTAIVLKLGEYRESVDVDFMCATANGYRLVRNIVSPQSLGDFTKAPLTYRREVSTSQYNVRTIAEIDGFPIKIEFVREARIELRGCFAGTRYSDPKPGRDVRGKAPRKCRSRTRPINHEPGPDRSRDDDPRLGTYSRRGMEARETSLRRPHR